MMRPILLWLAVILLRGTDQDVKVATWSVGKPDTEAYESLSFWIKENHRAYVRYNHGSSDGDTELQWLGPDTYNGRRAFRVSSPKPGAGSLVIAPDSIGIQVVDRRRHSTRSFYWEDENPPGDTARCPICAQDEKEAQDWLRRYFLH